MTDAAEDEGRRLEVERVIRLSGGPPLYALNVWPAGATGRGRVAFRMVDSSPAAVLASTAKALETFGGWDGLERAIKALDDA